MCMFCQFGRERAVKKTVLITLIDRADQQKIQSENAN